MDSLGILLIIFIFALFVISALKSREAFCATTGFTYDNPGKIPDIAHISRSSPFYDLNGIRSPSCSYKNYTYPPPMYYGPIECPEPEMRYRYWDMALLSHPQTPFLV